MRLKYRFEGTTSYPILLTAVSDIADVEKCDRAYACLAAWDIMWNNYLIWGIELNEQGRGFLRDNGMYFGVGVLDWDETAKRATDKEKETDTLYLAECTQDMMITRFANCFMKDDMYMQVLINSPYYTKRDELYFNLMNEDYYMLLGYYTFCEHKKETKNLAGFIVIDDGLEQDYYDCHIYMNPNAAHREEFADFYLESMNCSRDDLGLLRPMLDMFKREAIAKNP